MTSSSRLAVFLSHPIQYKSPVLRSLATCPDVDLQVFYYSTKGIVAMEESTRGRVPVWDVSLLTGYRYEFLKNTICEEKWRLVGVGPYLNPAVVSRLSTQRYDAIIVHSYGYFSDWLAYVTAKLRGIAVLFYGDVYKKEKRSNRMQFVRKVVRRTMIKGANACLAIGSVAMDVFHDEYKIPVNRVFLAPDVVDNDFFITETRRWMSEKNRLKASLGISENIPVVLCVAGMLPKKRQQDLVEAMRNIETPSQLVLVGDGPLAETVRQYCQKVLPNVILTGFINQSQLPSYYAIADVFVLPSLWEEFGMVVNEAMCAGLPIVASNTVAATKDLVIEGENGYTFPPGDVHALAIRLEELLVDAEKRQLFGQRSLEIISGWNVERTVAGILQALNYATGRNRKINLVD